MSIVNSVNLIGRLTRDLEVGTKDNSVYGRTAIAVNEGYKNKNNEWVDNTMFVDLIAWGDKFVNYLKGNFKKGVLVALNGELKIKPYVGKDGIKRTSVSIKIVSIKLLEPKKSLDSKKTDSNNSVPVFEPANDFGANSGISGEISTVDFENFSPIDDDDNIPF